MSPDFPKRSARKILERIIPPPSGGRDKRRPDKVGLVLPRCYAPGIVRLTLQTSSRLVGIRFQLGSLSASLIIFLLKFFTKTVSIIELFS